MTSKKNGGGVGIDAGPLARPFPVSPWMDSRRDSISRRSTAFYMSNVMSHGCRLVVWYGERRVASSDEGDH